MKITERWDSSLRKCLQKNISENALQSLFTKKKKITAEEEKHISLHCSIVNTLQVPFFSKASRSH